MWLRTGPTGPGPPERKILPPPHVVTLTSRRSTLPLAMRTRTPQPSPTRDAASLRSRSRSPRARSPRPTTGSPRTTPPTDPPRESAGVSAPSCPCSCAASPRQTNDVPTSHVHHKLTASFSRGSLPLRTSYTSRSTSRGRRGGATAGVVPTAAHYGEDNPRPVRSCMWHRTVDMWTSEIAAWAKFAELSFYALR